MGNKLQGQEKAQPNFFSQEKFKNGWEKRQQLKKFKKTRLDPYSGFSRMILACYGKSYPSQGPVTLSFSLQQSSHEKKIRKIYCSQKECCLWR
jgi:hypothetical protein